MKTSTPYYRQSAAATLTGFDSQTSGLTEAEAAERAKHIEEFTLPVANPFGNLSTQLQHSFGLRFGLLLLGAVGALYFSELKIAILLFSLALMLGLLSGFYERVVWHGRTSRNIRLPKHSNVVRANHLQNVSTKHIVPGDVIYLEAGDIVPADLRILKSSKLIVSETIFTNNSTAITKDSRTLERFVARDKQTNMLFFGSTVIQGNGYGLVTALGKHTELGRLLWTPKKSPRRVITAKAMKLQRYLDISVLVLAPILGVLALVNNWPASLTISLIATLLVVTSLLDFYISSPFIAAGHAHMLGRSGHRTLQLASLETIGATTHLISDLRTAFVPQNPTVQALHTGRKRYQITGKSFSKQAQQELGMLPLVSHLLARLPATSIFEQLLPSLPASAGYSYNYNASPQLKDSSLHASTWHSNEHKDLLVIGGKLPALLAIVSHINEQGHVRPMTNGDKERILRENTQSEALGTAYSHETDASKELIFAGFIEADYTPDAASYTAFRKLRSEHIHITLVSDESAEQTADLLQHIGLAQKDYTVIDHADIASFSARALGKLLAMTTVILSDVTGDDITRLAQAARAQGSVTVVGDRLELADVLSSADAVVARSSSLAADYAGIIMPSCTLAQVQRVLSQGRQTLTHLATVNKTTPVISFGLLALFWCMVAAQTLYDIPALISPLLLTFILVAVLSPVIISITWGKDPAHAAQKDIQKLLNEKHSVHHSIIHILTLLVVAFGAFFAFLSWHNIHIDGLAATGQTYSKAITITGITLALCFIVHIFISRTPSRHVARSTALNSPMFWFASIISGALLGGLAYNQQLQTFLGSSSIFAKDWLIIAAGVSLYALVATLAQYDRHHTRSAVATLHKAHKK